MRKTTKITLLTNENDWAYSEDAKEQYKLYCKENNTEYYESEVLDWALEQCSINEECDWDNFKYSEYAKAKVKLLGNESTYHRWDGYHKVYDKVFDSLYGILANILFDYEKTYKVWFESGKIHVTWSDHDSPCGGTHLVFAKVGGRFTLKDMGF